MQPDVDNHKLIFHPERVAEWRKSRDCFPVYVEIGPTNRCNHRCAFCALDYLEHGGSDIDTSVLCKNLEDMASHGVKSVMFAGEGEPLLHRDMGLFVQTAKSNGIDVSITTNGSLLSPEKADAILPCLSWMRFSVDAGTRKTYAYLHGTPTKEFDKVLRNIESAVKMKRDRKLETTLGVQAVLTSHNLAEIVSLAKRLKEIGADNLQVKPYSHHPLSKNDLSVDFERAEELRGALAEVSDDNFKVLYRAQTIRRIQSEREYSQCLGLPFFALIDARGEVLPCNLFYNTPEFSYGNINETLFSGIWAGNKRKAVLEKIRQKGVEDCRLGCRLDAINRYLDRLNNPCLHDNFI